MTTDDLEDFLVELSTAQTAGRTAMDRYRDFREVFLGSDAGRRVLHDILAMGKVFMTSFRKGDPHLLFAQEGRRSMAVQILKTVREEPQERPTRGRQIREVMR